MHSWLKTTTTLLLLSSAMTAADSVAFSNTPALAEVPAGRLRDDLVKLPVAARAKALQRLAGAPTADAHSLRSRADGQLLYQCAALDHGTRAAQDAASPALKLKAVGHSSVPISSPPIHHSKPGSKNVLYLDFNGATVSGTHWNTEYNVTTYVAKPYSIDSDLTTFSDIEQAAIFTIWDRVSEDYSSFDIDVTTEEPATFTDTTAWAVITPTTDANGKDLPHKGYGGVAWLDVFGQPNYHKTESPVWVTDMTVFAIADAASHEVGHNLSLKHDGSAAQGEYLSGFSATTASPSWGPIMGAPYDMTLSQWSKGDYAGATNHEDDLAIIATKLGYLPDDNGNTTATASSLRATANVFAVTGVIERTGDIDVFQVNLGEGPIIITALPHVSTGSTSGGNLDAKLTLISSTNEVLATSNFPALTPAQIIGTINKAGTYFLQVEGVGSGDPQATRPSGATNYGSIGQYILFSGAAPGTTTSGSTTAGVTTGGGTSGVTNPVTDPGTGGGTTSGGTPSYSAAQGSSSHCGLGGGALALIATCALALWTASRRR